MYLFHTESGARSAFTYMQSDHALLRWLLNSLPHNQDFLTTCRKVALETTAVGNGENAGDQHFLLFPQCFLLIKGRYNHLTFNPLDTHFDASTTDSF